MKKPEPASWKRMLDGRPVRNAAAEVSRESDGSLGLGVRRRPPSWVAWLQRRAGRTPSRTLALDPVGAGIWDLCDGQRTVEAVVDEFARAHRLTFHEARVAVTPYLKTLVQRGALVIVYPDGD